MDIQKLNQYKADGLLMSQNHPVHDLIIWNYTPKVQYEQLWDDITINARGLVTDSTGNIISKGFPKFWNIEENKHQHTNNFEVFEKLDGQYIGCFWYNGELIVNSRGSFTSPYALEARRILDEKYPRFIDWFNTKDKEWLNQDTWCFELIGFEQIVVNYPGPDLILTGRFEFNGTNWFDYGSSDVNVKIANQYCGIKIAKRYSGLDYTQIKQFNWKNAEGFVVRFSNGSRCKIKFEDYINLHRQMTNLSTTAIWEAMKNGTPVTEMLNDVPDEFYLKILEIESTLKSKFHWYRIEVPFEFIRYGAWALSKKDFAIAIKDHPWKAMLFSIYDHKDYDQHIWKLIKPDFERI